MTEEEAQGLATRLTRIWRPEGPAEWSVVSSSIFQFQAFLAPDARLNLNCNGADVGRSQYFLSLQKADSLQQARSGIILVCHEGGFAARESSPFATQWLPVFRRGCWLSGLYIEATAHEKVEWMRGFTQEEIDLWNLKF